MGYSMWSAIVAIFSLCQIAQGEFVARDLAMWGSERHDPHKVSSAPERIDPHSKEAVRVARYTYPRGNKVYSHPYPSPNSHPVYPEHPAWAGQNLRTVTSNFEIH